MMTSLLRKSGIFGMVVLMGAMLCSVSASAGVLYTTLGPGGQFDTTTGYLVNGSNFNNQVIADPFIPTATANLADAVLALCNVSNNNSPVNVYLESDNFGVPGAILDPLTQVGTIGPFPPGGLVTFNCSTCPLLMMGTQYWLVAVEADPNSNQEWNWAFNDPTGPIAFNTIGSATGPWNSVTAQISGFQIDGGSGSTPEPGSLILFGSGLLGVAGVVRRRLLG